VDLDDIQGVRANSVRPQFNTVQANGGNRGYQQLRSVKNCFGGQQYARSQMVAKFLVKGPFLLVLGGSFWALGVHCFAKKIGLFSSNFLPPKKRRLYMPVI
jgi:hypothetical protein